MVCRQLGFDGVEFAYISSAFGNVPDDFSYDDVACTGSESTLDECNYSMYDNCGPTEGAGVRCSSSETTTAGPTESTSAGPSDHYGTTAYLSNP